MLVTNRFNMIGMDGGIKLKQWPLVIPSLWDMRSLSSNNLQQLARSGVQGDFDGYSNGEANPDIGI